MHLVRIVMLTGAIPLLVGCSQVVQGLTEVTLDSRLIEQTVEEGILEQLGYAVKAECPGSMSGEPGDVRQCLVTDELGNNALVDITIQNYEGFVTWELRN